MISPEPRVSVVIAAYNAESFIGRAIASASEQRGVALEIIVVDDASTDGTVAAVRSLADADPRIRVLRQERNGGPAIARNAGFAASSGDWIAVLDADDAFLPGRLRALIDLAEREGADIVADNFCYHDPRTGTLSAPALDRTPPVEIMDFARYVRGARPFNREADLGLLKPIFRAESLRRWDLRYPVDIRHGEDFELIAAAFRRQARYAVDRQGCFYAYTVRSSGWSRTTIDYSSQIARARADGQAVPAGQQPGLARAFEDRARALERLQGNRARMLRRRNANRLEGLLMDALDPSSWRYHARRIGRRLGLR